MVSDTRRSDACGIIFKTVQEVERDIAKFLFSSKFEFFCKRRVVVFLVLVGDNLNRGVDVFNLLDFLTYRLLDRRCYR